MFRYEIILDWSDEGGVFMTEVQEVAEWLDHGDTRRRPCAT